MRSSTLPGGNILPIAQRWVKGVPKYFGHPANWLGNYNPNFFRSDLIASLTIAIMLLPQAIAYGLIAELPPQTGLFAAMIAALIGGLWGSSHHLHTGPTNTTSLIVLSGLLTVATPGTEYYLVAAGVMAVWSGVIRLIMGVAKLGILVNFVSDSVVVGFTAGAGILIVAKQLRNILRVEGVSSAAFSDTIANLIQRFDELHPLTLVIGLVCIIALLVFRRFTPKIPGPLIVMVAGGAVVWAFGLDAQGVNVLGELPRGIPPIQALPIFDLDLLVSMGPSIVAVAMIGLIEAASISRAVASRSGQYLNSDQEFVGQGLANIAVGFFSGYPVAGSLTRSVVNYEAGARSQLSSIMTSGWILLAMLVLAPAAVYLPAVSLAAILVVTGSRMINIKAARQIIKTSGGDTIVMAVTFFSTLLFSLEFAVLTGVLVSFARYIINSSMPTVREVLPNDTYTHFDHYPEKASCPQLGIMTVYGSLFFGAARHVEDEIRENIDLHPTQNFLLLRMHRVNRIDISGIHMLETVVRLYRQRGGDVFITGLRPQIMERLELSGFHDLLGEENYLNGEDAIEYIFYHKLNPSTCVYNCPHRVWRECQSLPKGEVIDLPAEFEEAIPDVVPGIQPEEFWQRLHESKESGEPLEIIDVREPAEWEQGHLRGARLIPLSSFLKNEYDPIPKDQDVIFVCRSGRRSQQVAHWLMQQGYDRVINLEGGMIALEVTALPRSGRQT